MKDVLEQIQSAVKTKDRVRPAAGGTKPALSGWSNLDIKPLAGILEYNPQEYTFTALAGTPLKLVQETLASHGQQLPFDPPLVEAGATLGGTVAAGLSGPGRFRYGGVRDFLLGVKFVSGEGHLVTGGGKVVKNAAGFDFPKLMVGSLGRFGIMVELSFKVFPKPETHKTIKLHYDSFEEANQAMQVVAQSGAEVTCLDILPPATLLIRLGGLAEAMDKRINSLQGLTQAAEVIEDDEALWRDLREFRDFSHTLIKVPLNPGQVLSLEKTLAAYGVTRHYSVGANVAYLSWSASEDTLSQLLGGMQLSGLVLRGAFSQPIIGKQPDWTFASRILQVLDPQGKFSLEVSKRN